MDHQAVAEDGDVGALARRACDLERDEVLAPGHRLLEHPVEPLVLEEKDRIGIAYGGEQQSLRLVWGRRDDDLQTGGRESSLDRLRVVQRAVRVPAHRRAHDHRHRPVAVAAVAVLRRFVDDRVERHVGEVGELHLGHRPLAPDRKSQRDARDRRLRKRCVDDARLAETLAQSVGDQEHPALLAHVLTKDHHAVVALHLLGQRRAQRRDHVHLFGLPAGGWLDRLRRLDRVHVGERVFGAGIVRLHTFFGRLGDLLFDGLLGFGHLLGVQHALVEEPLLEAL